MNYISVLILMLFCHYLADYPMQKRGLLGDMKQKAWWEKQPGYNENYKYDYIPALLIHSFSWSFMIMLPIYVHQWFSMNVIFVVVLIINTTIHMLVDDLKANNHVLNLIQDQFIHLVQIIWTSLLYFI